MSVEAQQARSIPSVFQITSSKILLTLLIWTLSGVSGSMIARFRPVQTKVVAVEDSAIPEWVKHSVAHDPPYEKKYVLPVVYTLNGVPATRPIAARKNVLVFLWKCNSCSSQNMLRWIEQQAKQYPNTHFSAIIIRGQVEDVRTLTRGFGKNAEALLDSTGNAARTLNAVFLARTYVFGADRSLHYVSGYRASRDEIERKIRPLLKDK